MSAEVKYRISGKADNSAIDQVKNGFSSLTKVANTVQNVFKGFVALKAVQAVGGAVNGYVSAFQTQQNAIAQLTNSISNNSNLTAGSLQRIIAFSSDLQKRGIYGDEEIQKQASYLASLGLTEDNIKGVLEASTALAAKGIMPLDSAVKNMSKQFGGMAGELGEKIPALRTLTAEQLKAGEGIALVQKQFAGALETAASTLEGKTQQVQNTIGDIKEKVGSVFGELKMGALTAIQPFIERFDEWLGAAANKIINLIKAFPQVVSIIGQMMSLVFSNLFNIEYLISLISALGKYIWDVLKTVITNIGPIIGNLFIQVVNYLMYVHYRIAKGIDWIGASLKDAFLSVAETFINSIIDGVNKVIDTVSKIPGIDIAKISNVDFKTDSAKTVKETTGSFEEWSKASWSGALKTKDVDVLGNLKNIVGDTFSGLKNLWTDVFTPLVDGTEGLTKQLEEIANAPQKALAPITGTTTSTTTEEAATESKNLNIMGDMSILSLLKDFVSPLTGMIKSMSSLQMILNPMQIVFKGIFDVLKPIIDSLLRPLIGIFRIIGTTIGKVLAPILMQLSPIIELISKAFVFLYNKAIAPLANAIIWVISTVYNMVANLVNAVIGAINKIPGVNVQWRMAGLSYENIKLQQISESDLDTAGAEAGVGYSGESTASGASYSGERDITNNFYFNIDKLSGNDRDEALAILEQIKSAIQLGLATY